MKIHIYALALLLAASLCGCAAIGAAIGGTVGSIFGPPGTVGGAVAGAEVGDIVAGKKRAEAETKERDYQIAQMRSEVVELRATIKANGAIDAHNAHLAPGETPTRHVEPTPDGDKSHLAFWIAFAVVLAVLGGTAAYIFRHPLRTWLAQWWLRLSDALRGRAPSVPKPTPAPEPTPLNPNP